VLTRFAEKVKQASNELLAISQLYNESTLSAHNVADIAESSHPASLNA